MLIQDSNSLGSKMLRTEDSNDVLQYDTKPALFSQKLSSSALSNHKETNKKISEEFEKRHFKVGKFKLCFPFSNGSADLSIKINSMAKDSKGSYSQAASTSNIMKQLVSDIKRHYQGELKMQNEIWRGWG